MKLILKTSKFRPEIWLAASSINSLEAGRGLSPLVSVCLVVGDSVSRESHTEKKRQYCVHDETKHVYFSFFNPLKVTDELEIESLG